MKRVDLQNKRIFYLGPVYFDYDKYLIKKLNQLGANVTPFELHLNTIGLKFIRKFKPSELESYKKNYYDKALSKSNYDYVLVRHGFQLPPSFYQQLRKTNPNARFINFHWDSLKPNYDYRPILSCFDKVFSFDYKDCATHKEVQYLPLYYIDEYSKVQSNGNKNKNDILFIGAWRNTERYNLVKKTEKICEQADLKFSHYLYQPLWTYFVSIKEGIVPKEVRFKKLSPREIIRLFSISNTIIDFPSSFQTGLTIRTFEALAAGKKLITTNKNIITEPFYNPEMINIVELDNFKLDIDFIKSNPKLSLKEKIKDYSLENYIYKLLDE
ncbi:hypothetical protein EFY79_08790 [Hanamia caeni]|jgi:hypothetical protein|uniref:Glycosyltransferase n=1 Tax=Hanamia caeni TaxID=2294116 RepID=A0A3M9NI76_9BACT|nr:hypothetical protein [Hanamia caeni]RNI37480.1 hypothetical protein EFY79_08790 [Hanamia caeni]